MNDSNDGGQAFPRIERIQTPQSINWERPQFSEVQSADGMSLRDYFASKAMLRLDAPIEYTENFVDLDMKAESARWTEDSYREWSERCYRMADAMLKARAR